MDKLQYDAASNIYHKYLFIYSYRYLRISCYPVCNSLEVFMNLMLIRGKEEPRC